MCRHSPGLAPGTTSCNARNEPLSLSHLARRRGARRSPPLPRLPRFTRYPLIIAAWLGAVALQNCSFGTPVCAFAKPAWEREACPKLGYGHCPAPGLRSGSAPNAP